MREPDKQPTLRLRQPVFTQAEADKRAKAALNERAKKFLTGEAEAIGLPELRPDRNVELDNLGDAVLEDLLHPAGDAQDRQQRLSHALQGEGDGPMNLRSNAPSETAHEAGGYVKGVAVALVTQNKDDDGLCRVKVRYPWHDKPRESYWARLAMPMAGKDRGIVFIPEVGDEVLVAFEREDLRFPYVLGALWNGKDKPPLANDDGKNDKRIIKSRKKHYLLFDDGAQGVVELAHEKGRKVALRRRRDRAARTSKGNQLKIDSNSGAMTIEANGQLNIKAATITIEATGTLELKASATLTMRGALVNIN